jgi:hypothetical protein
VILQPFSNISKLELLLDAAGVEGGLASDAGAEEELGRAERTLGDDDLLASAGDVTRTGGGLSEFDTDDATLSISVDGGREDEFGAGRSDEDVEVLAAVEDTGREVGGGGGRALSFRVDDGLEASDLWERSEVNVGVQVKERRRKRTPEVLVSMFRSAFLGTPTEGCKKGARVSTRRCRAGNRREESAERLTPASMKACVTSFVGG